MALHTKIKKYFKIDLDSCKSFLSPIQLLSLSVASIPEAIEAFFHSPRFLLLLIPPDLPEIVFSTTLECFSRFPVKAVVIIPDLIFSMWYNRFRSLFNDSFVVPIDRSNFIANRKFHFNFNFRVARINFGNAF